MTDQHAGTPPPEGPDGQSGAADDPYQQYLDTAAETPALGYIVMYSVFDAPVTHSQLVGWWNELGLNTAFLPPEPRPVDAFEKTTSEVKHTYSLSEEAKEQEDDRSATILVRQVRRDGREIVRHVVQEIRNGTERELRYRTKVGECVFRFDRSLGLGAGEMGVTADFSAIADPREKDEIRAVLDRIRERYRRRCIYLGADRLRGAVRGYIEHLNAIRVRPSGGVYFVSSRHKATLDALQVLIKRFGVGSLLNCIPLPDEEQNRQMVIQAFRTRAREDLQRLALEIAEAQQADKVRKSTAASLHARYTQLQETAAEHGQLLHNDLKDINANLGLVQMQLVSLLAKTTSDSD